MDSGGFLFLTHRWIYCRSSLLYNFSVVSEGKFIWWQNGKQTFNEKYKLAETRVRTLRKFFLILLWIKITIMRCVKNVLVKNSLDNRKLIKKRQPDWMDINCGIIFIGLKEVVTLFNFWPLTWTLMECC